MSDPWAAMTALARRLEERARQELAASRDGTLDETDRDIARVRAIACRVIAEEAVVSLSEPDRSAKT